MTGNGKHIPIAGENPLIRKHTFMDINGGFTAILMGHFIYFMHCHVWLPKVSMDQLWWSPWLSHQFWAGQILDVHPGYPNLFVSSNMARAGKGRFVGRNGAIDDVNYIMEKSSNGGFSNAPCLSTDSTRGELGSRIKMRFWCLAENWGPKRQLCLNAFLAFTDQTGQLRIME